MLNSVLAERLRLLTLVAMRNLRNHRVKNAIVGGIMFFGTLLVVVGTSLTDSVERSMQESITASMAGHLQVFSADAEDSLSLIGVPGGASQDVGEIEDFSTISSALKQLPNVDAVVPMAVGMATSFARSDFDRTVAELRRVVKSGDDNAVERVIEQLRAITGHLAEERRNDLAVTANIEETQADISKLEKVTTETFWRDFDENPQQVIEYLDVQIAPLSEEGRMRPIRYLATDPREFAKSFDRFKIVDGEMIPEGTRGLLLSKRYYERFIKHKVAREFDDLREELSEGATISGDATLKGRIDRMSRQYATILFQLDPRDANEVEVALRRYLDRDGDLKELLPLFLSPDDTNFEERYRWFYEHIAPHIELYDARIGDVMTLTGFTETGYIKSVNVRFWGTFNFRGLEGSDLAGATNLLDLVTFRELYGKMTDAQREELSAIKEDVGIETVEREDAEDALFGGGEELVVEGEEEGFEEFDDIEVADAEELDESLEPEELQRGLVLNAAVILKDAERISETAERIRELSERSGLNIQTVDWEGASGVIGQFTLVVQLILYTAIFVIFLVALVIINNSMVMSTMERTPEIGTMRAIGAHRWAVMLMVFLETLVLCVLAGGLGAAAGAGMIVILGSVGIPATTDVFVFLFGGERLYPTVGAWNISLAMIVVLGVSLLSTLYPALLATRVQPIVAMRQE